MLRKSLSTLLAVLLLASFAFAQDMDLQGATLLRLDAVDASKSPQGELVLYASFLDKYRKPITATDAHQWKVEIDGTEVEPEQITVKKLSDTDKGVAVVVVAAAYQAFQDDWFNATRNGASRLLNSLRAVDLSALVTYSQAVDATGGLSPSHNESVGWLNERKVDGTNPLLYDAIEKGLEFFPPDYTTVGPNRALVVVSDGWDTDTFKAAKLKDQIDKVKNLAKKRNVRVDVIGASIDESQGLQDLKSIASYTGGTYRPAVSAAAIEELFGHLQSELLDQHVIDLKPKKFEGGKEATFKVEVDHESKSYSSNSFIAFVARRESHILTWVLIGGGGLVGLLLLFFVIRLIVRVIRNRRDDEPVEEGPDLSACPQCNNMIPPDWKVCQYCEALPHKGRLTVVSVGDLNGRTFFLKDSLSNIGSATGNTIVLIDKSVSKRHAGIKIQDNRFELADFGSTNGVLVNGQRITKQFLKNKDTITIGTVELEFTLK